MLYMRSAEEDRTARAVIRDEALGLFAAHGPDAVTVRQIAAAAGVSPALVVHHFGSKEGLREAVDEHVLGLFEALIGEMTAEGAPDLYDPAATGSLAEAIVRHLPPGSPVPGYLAGWLAILAAFTVIALTYGALGLLLGVLVKGDLEGFFLIIMGSLMDTFLQNPLGNPIAGKPILEWFPSFGPMQFAAGGAYGHTALWGHLLLGLGWTAAFTAAGLVIFRIRTRSRRHPG